MPGHIVLFDASLDPSVLTADGHVVTRLSNLDALEVSAAVDVALIPARHPHAMQISTDLQSRQPHAAQVSVLCPGDAPIGGLDGAVVWPLRANDRRLLHWMAEGVRHTRNVFALTEQVRLDAPLAEMGKLVVQVVHEIRSPLTALSAKLQWLKHKARDNPELAQMSGQLDDEVTRLARLSTDLIELGRARSAARRSTEVWQTLQEVLALYRETCERSGIELIIRGPDEHKKVSCASEELHQIFQNLLTNAIDATPPEEQIVIDVRNGVQALEVEFRNPGHLSDDTIAHAFDLFFTTKRNGSGLGLPIVKRIVTGVAGDVVAQNDGDHVVFKVKLPLVQSA